MFEIKWTHQAEQDYLNTLEYWISHNKSNEFSLKLMNEVEKAEKHISQHPFAGTSVILSKRIYRTLILRHFSLIYKLEKEIIYIIAFWDNRKNPENLNIKIQNK